MTRIPLGVLRVEERRLPRERYGRNRCVGKAKGLPSRAFALLFRISNARSIFPVARVSIFVPCGVTADFCFGTILMLAHPFGSPSHDPLLGCYSIGRRHRGRACQTPAR